jgi:hypothetical protein
MFRYAEGKWTIKEVVGHLLDTERVYAYRLLRISRNDSTALPGFEETRYVPEGQFTDRAIGDLVSEFRLLRVSTIALANGIPSVCHLKLHPFSRSNPVEADPDRPCGPPPAP